jgi:hypothetical protein
MGHLVVRIECYEICDADDLIPITGLIIRNSKMHCTYRHSTKEFAMPDPSQKRALEAGYVLN